MKLETYSPLQGNTTWYIYIYGIYLIQYTVYTANRAMILLPTTSYQKHKTIQTIYRILATNIRKILPHNPLLSHTFLPMELHRSHGTWTSAKATSRKHRSCEINHLDTSCSSASHLDIGRYYKLTFSLRFCLVDFFVVKHCKAHRFGISFWGTGAWCVASKKGFTSLQVCVWCFCSATTWIWLQQILSTSAIQISQALAVQQRSPIFLVTWLMNQPETCLFKERILKGRSLTKSYLIENPKSAQRLISD